MLNSLTRHHADGSVSELFD